MTRKYVSRSDRLHRRSTFLRFKISRFLTILTDISTSTQSWRTHAPQECCRPERRGTRRKTRRFRGATERGTISCTISHGTPFARVREEKERSRAGISKQKGKTRWKQNLGGVSREKSPRSCYFRLAHRLTKHLSYPRMRRIALHWFTFAESFLSRAIDSNRYLSDARCNGRPRCA